MSVSCAAGVPFTFVMNCPTFALTPGPSSGEMSALSHEAPL